MFNEEDQHLLIEWLADYDWIEKKEYGQNIEYLECVSDILKHPVFQSMNQFIQHGNTTTMTHCIRVSYLSYQICKKFGWNYRLAARAGLLHDLFLYDWHNHAKSTGEYFHGLTHPKKALTNARKYFHLTLMEEDAILRHMWPLTPIPPKSLEGLALIYADKMCSTAETFGSVKNLLAGEYHGVLGRVFK